jgi:hypothetical protein
MHPVQETSLLIPSAKVILGWRLAIDDYTDCRLPIDDWGLYFAVRVPANELRKPLQ